jgi:hypothetical protein
MPESGTYGSVRGAAGNSRPYREHGIRAKRSKSGAVSFDVLVTEATHAPI